jgi:hypothetical protein
MLEEDKIIYRLKYPPINVELIDHVEVDGIDLRDHPDYADAYIARAWWKNGNEFTEEEIEQLHNDHVDFVYDCIYNYIF